MLTDVHVLARLGARIRIAQLVTEIDTLLKAFPDLGSTPARPAPGRKGPRRAARRKGTLSAAGRARIVAAQKKRWAATKAGKTTRA